MKEQLRRVWASVRQPASTDAPRRKADHLVSLCRALLSERGEVSGARIAAEALASYQGLSEAGREAFFACLVDEYSPDPAEVARAIDAYRADPSPPRPSALYEAAEPRRQELFRRLNVAPGGTRVLVQMRTHLLRTLTGHPERSTIDADLVHLFRSWQRVSRRTRTKPNRNAEHVKREAPCETT